MAEKVQLAAKTSKAKENSASTTRKIESPQSMSSPADQVLYLQRTFGNQAVQRLIKSGALQAKLKIGQPGDKYEQEADRVADQVMRMPEPGVQRQVDEEEEEEEMLQAKPLTEEITQLVQRQVEPEEEEKEELQTKSTSSHLSEVTPNLESNILSLKGGGQPLPESDRAYFEPRFGHDFSNVRVHTGVNVTKIAESVYARAFTLGNNIVFGHGQYSTGIDKGRRLLGHELTHVIQQDKSGFVSGNSRGPISEVSKIRTESIQRAIEPHPEISGDFIIRVNSGINDVSAFIGQVSRDLESKVIPERVPTLMLIDRFRDRLRICWNEVLSLIRPNRRQIIVRLEGWGGYVSRFILVSPRRIVLPSPEESREPGEGTLPPLQPPSTETEPSEQAPRACTRISSEAERTTVENSFRLLHADNPLAMRLLRNFMDCRGTLFPLTENEMRVILPYFSIQTNYTGYTRDSKEQNLNFWVKWAQLMRSTDNSIQANLTSNGFANLRGTLGIFTVYWDGHLSKTQSIGGWEFSGEIWFDDTWNLNSASHRGIFNEVSVRVSRFTINGASFPIVSVRVNANEIGATGWMRDNQPSW